MEIVTEKSETSQSELEFLKQVFKEANDHLRATDQKSLIVCGFYLTAVGAYLSSVASGKWCDASGTCSNGLPFFDLAVIVLGFCAYMVQHWYRAWKRHYLDVALNIRRTFVPIVDQPELLPYWLRDVTRPARTSADNILKIFVAFVNLAPIWLFSYHISEPLPRLAWVLGPLVLVAYILLLKTGDRFLFGEADLNA